MKTSLTLLLFTLLGTACTMEEYQTGDGKYSYLRADFVQAHTGKAGVVDYAVTDEGNTLELSAPLSVAWAQKADTTYRALFYYNKVENTVQPVAMSPVYVLNWKASPVENTEDAEPFVFNSAWMSPNKAYINLGLTLKTGTPDDPKARQSIGIVCTTIERDAQGNPVYHLVLTHKRNGVPEYYSQQFYAAIPIAQLPKGASVAVTVNTYNGNVVKLFSK